MKIVLEGNEFVGKTTVSNILRDVYGYEVHRQPGNENIRKFIKEDILADKESDELPEEILTMAYAIDRLYQQEYELDFNKPLIIDRSVLTSFILQTKEIDKSIIAAINQLVREPDMVFWLRVTDRELKNRITARGGLGKDAYDKAAFENKRRYEEFMPKYRTKLDSEFIEIFGDKKAPEEVARQIHYHILEYQGRDINPPVESIFYDTNKRHIADAFRDGIKRIREMLTWN